MALFFVGVRRGRALIGTGMVGGALPVIHTRACTLRFSLAAATSADTGADAGGVAVAVGAACLASFFAGGVRLAARRGRTGAAGVSTDGSAPCLALAGARFGFATCSDGPAVESSLPFRGFEGSRFALAGGVALFFDFAPLACDVDAS